MQEGSSVILTSRLQQTILYFGVTNVWSFRVGFALAGDSRNHSSFYRLFVKDYMCHRHCHYQLIQFTRSPDVLPGLLVLQPIVIPIVLAAIFVIVMFRFRGHMEIQSHYTKRNASLKSLVRISDACVFPSGEPSTCLIPYEKIMIITKLQSSLKIYPPSSSDFEVCITVIASNILRI